MYGILVLCLGRPDREARGGSGTLHGQLVLSIAKWSLVWPPWLRYWRICYVAIQVGLENGQSRTYYGQLVLNTA